VGVLKESLTWLAACGPILNPTIYLNNFTLGLMLEE